MVTYHPDRQMLTEGKPDHFLLGARRDSGDYDADFGETRFLGKAEFRVDGFGSSPG